MLLLVRAQQGIVRQFLCAILPLRRQETAWEYQQEVEQAEGRVLMR